MKKMIFTMLAATVALSGLTLAQKQLPPEGSAPKDFTLPQ